MRANRRNCFDLSNFITSKIEEAREHIATLEDYKDERNQSNRFFTDIQTQVDNLNETYTNRIERCFARNRGYQNELPPMPFF